MRKLLLLLPGLALHCGFGIAPFDVTEVPKADAARKQALAACRACTDFKSDAEVIDCVVAADREFARRVRLEDRKLIDDYSARVKLLDADIGAGTLKPGEASVRFRVLQAGFFKAINDGYVAYQADAAQDLVRETNEAAERSAMQMKSGGMDSMNGMGN
jgi:hypothetical protein